MPDQKSGKTEAPKCHNIAMKNKSTERLFYKKSIFNKLPLQLQCITVIK